MKKIKRISKRYRGLSKYDAPLRIQFEWGYNAFRKDPKRSRVPSSLHPNTMQYREWLRGYNVAYFENLKKVRNNERLGKKRNYEGKNMA